MLADLHGLLSMAWTLTGSKAYNIVHGVVSNSSRGPKVKEEETREDQRFSRIHRGPMQTRVAAGSQRLNPCNNRDGTCGWSVPCTHLQREEPISMSKRRRRFEAVFDSKIGCTGPTVGRSPAQPHLHHFCHITTNMVSKPNHMPWLN